MTTLTTTRSRYGLAAADRQLLAMSYGQLVKAGNDSVRAAWRFGQTVDSLTDAYTLLMLAESLGVSYGTVHRYRRFFLVYQTPELALSAAEELETFNIDALWRFAVSGQPEAPHRPLAGRKFRYRCSRCHTTEVAREEYDPDTGATIDPDTGMPVPEPEPAAVTPVRFRAV